MMYSFDRIVIEFFRLFDRYVSKKYVTEEDKFIRERKMTQKEYIAYIITQRSCTSYIETVRFFTIMMKNDFKTISSQAIGKQRMFIDPQAFIDMNECFIDNLYNKYSGFSKLKGYIVSACDRSIVDIPNVTLTRIQFLVGDEHLLKEKRIRARVSCFLDVHSKHILTAKIAETTVNEIDLAIEHLKNINKRFNIEKLITVYDRGYASIELMAKTMDLNSKFLIRLPKNVFKHLIKQMKTNDEIIKINLTNNRLSHFRDENLREKTRKMGRLEIRIAIVDIGNKEPEILATNLTTEEFTTEELKELYNKRWTVETGFDRLKNLIEIEDFSGIRRPIIEQDFYAHIFVYNLAITIKKQAEYHITRTPRNKDEKITYQSNFAKIIGNIYLFFFDLIFGTRRKKEQIINFILNEASKQLTQEKEDERNKKERKIPDVENKHPGNKKKTH